MYKIDDIKQLPLGAELLVKRKYGNGEPFTARAGTVGDYSGSIYVFIDNGNGGEILTTVDLDEIIGIVQDDIIVDWANCSSDQLVTTGNKISITKPKYDCLRADGIPKDCDCCEGYDSRVCIPVATQYHDLRIKYNELRAKYNRT